MLLLDIYTFIYYFINCDIFLNIRILEITWSKRIILTHGQNRSTTRLLLTYYVKFIFQKNQLNMLIRQTVE